MSRDIGHAAPNAITPLAQFEFERPEVGPCDVRIDIEYCGVCHSDVQTRTIPVQDIDSAFEQILAGEVGYRFVIDNPTLRS